VALACSASPWPPTTPRVALAQPANGRVCVQPLLTTFCGTRRMESTWNRSCVPRRPHASAFPALAACSYACNQADLGLRDLDFAQQEVKDRTRLTVKLDLNDADEVSTPLFVTPAAQSGRGAHGGLGVTNWPPSIVCAGFRRPLVREHSPLSEGLHS
jgi:hypothetical protein